MLKVRWRTLRVRWCTHCFPLFLGSLVRSQLLCMLRCMSSELHGFGETVETEQLGRPALKAPLHGGFEVFQRTQLQQG